MEITVSENNGQENLKSERDKLNKSINNRERLLFVDDDAAILEGYKFIFENEGFSVDLAMDSKSLMELLQKNDYDMIILDYYLSEEKGIDLARDIHRIRPEQRLTFISGNRNSENEIKKHDISITGFLMKPLKVEEMLNYIRDKLANTD